MRKELLPKAPQAVENGLESPEVVASEPEVVEVGLESAKLLRLNKNCGSIAILPSDYPEIAGQYDTDKPLSIADLGLAKTEALLATGLFAVE